MTRYRDFAFLENASDSILSLFSAAAAERVLGVYISLSPAEDGEWARDAMDLVWSAIGGDADVESCADALEVLEENEDVDEDDDGDCGFIVARSLDVVGLALSCAVRPEFAQADMAANTVETVLDSLDFMLSGERVVVTKRGDALPSPGALLSNELSVHDRFFSALRNAQLEVGSPAVPGRVVAEVREAAMRAGEINAQAAQELAAVKGWNHVP
ncbi:hypothetical protein ACWD4J_36825 [Streptomyces sp. NPDC002577]